MSTSTTTRHSGLDTLRALAILSVMPFHIISRMPQWTQPAIRFGWMGVDLFFVLSGYLIGAQLLRPAAHGSVPSLKHFYLRRAWRILPAYLVVLSLYLFVPIWRERPGLAHAWQFLTFTLNLNIDYAHTSAFSHAWSLCVEEHYYLVLPLLVLALLRRSSIQRTTAIALAVFALGIGLRALALHHLRQCSPGDDTFNLYYLEHIYYPTWTRLDGLLAGVLLAATQLFRPVWWQGLIRRTHLLLTAGIALIAAAMYLFAGRWKSAYGPSACGTLIGFPVLAAGLSCLLLSALSERSLLGRRIPGTTTLATLAFSLYLSHKAMFHLVELAFPTFCDEHPIAVLPLFATAALAGAGVLYFAVERPCLKLRDRGRHTVDAVALADPAL